MNFRKNFLTKNKAILENPLKIQMYKIDLHYIHAKGTSAGARKEAWPFVESSACTVVIG